MMLGVVGSDGSKMEPFFFEQKKEGGGIDQSTYIHVMETKVYPWIKANYEDRDLAYLWTQDGAPGRNSKCCCMI